MRELEDQQLSAGLQDTPHGGESRRFVGDVAQAEPDRDAVEAAVRKRQVLRVGLGVAHVAYQPVVDQSVPASGEHRRVDVGEHHETQLSDLSCEACRQISGAAGHVESPLAGTQIGERQGKSLPQAMHACRHEIVHQVVVSGYGIEHAPDAARLVAPGHPLVAEICCRVVRHESSFRSALILPAGTPRRPFKPRSVAFFRSPLRYNRAGERGA